MNKAATVLQVKNVLNFKMYSSQQSTLDFYDLTG